MANTPHPAVVWCSRHYVPMAAAVLALAAINLCFRLGSEIVTEWDESLYAITAWEAVEHGRWIGTTFLGHIDYYNSKPPLNVWLIGLAFQTLGPSLISLRITSVVAAWLTVAVLQEWTRRCLGPAVALVSGLVLSTSFGFLYVHAGRSGNPDALFALLILLTVVTLWASRERPVRRLWLGPIAAAIFLLKGTAVLMPLLIIGAVEYARRRHQTRDAGERIPVRRPAWRYDMAAWLLFLLPVGMWAVARWRVDGWQFFEKMAENDLIGVSLHVLDGHTGGGLFYLDVLQKNHFDWLAAGLAACVLAPFSWPLVKTWIRSTRPDGFRVLIAIWIAVVVLVPTAMRTKLPWYLNSFYPAFALGIGWVIVRAACHETLSAVRKAILFAAVVAAFCVAEYRLFWYSHHMRDLASHVQGMILADRHTVSGRRVFSARWDNADRFVVMAARAEAEVSTGLDDFMARSERGDYLVADPDFVRPGLIPVRRNSSSVLYQRQD